MADVCASLTYRDVKAALSFLQSAFGLEPMEVVTDEHGAIRFASVSHADGVVLIQPDVPEELHGSHLGQGWVYVAVTDADTHFERARSAGAMVLGPPHEAFEGGLRGYSARDPEGNLWSFGTDRPRADRGESPGAT
jgi:uncharacterized glyoxalase superfamily protein PhnB